MKLKRIFAAALCAALAAAPCPAAPDGERIAPVPEESAGAIPAADAEPAALASAAGAAPSEEAEPVEPARRPGRAPLMRAAQTGDAGAVKALLESGARVNARGANGTTALMDAAFFSGDPETARVLIAAGADVNAADKDGLTPLMLALYANEDTAAAEVLLEAGADARARAESGWTPLMFALRAGKPAPFIATLLQKYGARAEEHRNARDGTTPMMIAAQYSGDPAVVATLYEAGGEAARPRGNGDQPLHFAARNATPAAGDIVRLLTGFRARVDCVNRDGWTPLMYAAMFSDRTDLIAALLDEGAAVNARKGDGMTPVMLAAASAAPNALEIAKTLIAAGADTEMADNNGRTPFLVALRSGHSAEMARFLLDRADEGRARREETERALGPVLDAVRTYATVVALRRDAPDGENVSPEGETAPSASEPSAEPDPGVERASFRSRLREFLSAGGAADAPRDDGTVSPEGGTAPSPADARTAAAENATDGETVSPEGKTALSPADTAPPPLMLAAVNPNEAAPAIIAWLLEQGERIDERDDSGRTALICAVRYNPSPLAARALIEAGADTRVTFRGNSLRRLLRFNRRMEPSDKKELAALLKKVSRGPKQGEQPAE